MKLNSAMIVGFAIGMLFATSTLNAEPALACRVVHGRLSLGSGTPGYRIWPVGSRRLLGVEDVHGNTEPDTPVIRRIRKLIGSPLAPASVYGDYLVCPLTREKPGHMQMVYIQHASNLHSLDSK